MRHGVPRLLGCARWTALGATCAIGLVTIASIPWQCVWYSNGEIRIEAASGHLQIGWLLGGWNALGIRVHENKKWNFSWNLGWKTRTDAHHVLSVSLLVPLVLLALTTRALWRTKRWWWQEGHCNKCGYDLTGNVSGRCPECGESVSLEGGRRMPRKVMAEWIVYAAMWALFLGWAFLWPYELLPNELFE